MPTRCLRLIFIFPFNFQRNPLKLVLCILSMIYLSLMNDSLMTRIIRQIHGLHAQQGWFCPYTLSTDSESALREGEKCSRSPKSKSLTNTSSFLPDYIGQRSLYISLIHEDEYQILPLDGRNCRVTLDRIEIEGMKIWGHFYNQYIKIGKSQSSLGALLPKNQ